MSCLNYNKVLIYYYKKKNEKEKGDLKYHEIKCLKCFR